MINFGEIQKISRKAKYKSNPSPIQIAESVVEEVIENAMSGEKETGKVFAMKKSEFTELEEFVKSSTLPTGAPSMGGGGEEQGESKLAGKGKQSGSGTSASGTGTSGAPSPKKEKLSEDDAEDEKQMKDHKKPIEVTRKSLTPANQREMVAKEHAVLVSRLQKSEDVVVEIERPETSPEKEEIQKSHTWNQGPDSLVQYSNKSDLEALELLKSGDGFYHFASPSVGRGVPGVAQFIECPMCKGRMSKSLTACPECGYGEVTHRVMPMSIAAENQLAKSETRGPLLRPKKHIDVDVSNGIVIDNEEN